MKTIIMIDCDEDNEVIQHINALTKDLKKQILNRRKTPDDLSEIVSYDNNCYGTHKAITVFDDDLTDIDLFRKLLPLIQST